MRIETLVDLDAILALVGESVNSYPHNLQKRIKCFSVDWAQCGEYQGADVRPKINLEFYSDSLE